MAMKFAVQQKGQMYLVVNESTGYVKGRFKEKGEAEVHRDRLQQQHNDGIEQVSAKLNPSDKGAGGSGSTNFEAGD